jgi:hypothetical protein
MSHKCDQCEYTSDKPYNLKRHVERQHSQAQKEEVEAPEAGTTIKKSAGRGRPRKNPPAQTTPKQSEKPNTSPREDDANVSKLCGPNCRNHSHEMDHESDNDTDQPHFVDEDGEFCRVYVVHIIKNPAADDLIVRKRAHIVPIAAYRPPLIFYEREALEFMDKNMPFDNDPDEEANDETETDAEKA